MLSYLDAEMQKPDKSLGGMQKLVKKLKGDLSEISTDLETFSTVLSDRLKELEGLSFATELPLSLPQSTLDLAISSKETKAE
jgi:hypothetical protein